MTLFRGVPSDGPCHVANCQLWEVFVDQIKKKTGREPSHGWSEAEVVQWLDLEGDQVFLGNDRGRSQQGGSLLPADGEAGALAA